MFYYQIYLSEVRLQGGQLSKKWAITAFSSKNSTKLIPFAGKAFLVLENFPVSF